MTKNGYPSVSVVHTRIPVNCCVFGEDRDDDISWKAVKAYTKDIIAGVEMHPIWVEPLNGGYYRIINGRHRWLAALGANRKRIMAFYVEDEL